MARLRGEASSGAEAGYIHFHTLCMGVKLALSGANGSARRLRNVRIDELWEEVRRRGVPRHEWRAFARERLVRVEALRRVGLEQLRDQVLGEVGDAAPLGQREQLLQVLGRALDLPEELRV